MRNVALLLSAGLVFSLLLLQASAQKPQAVVKKQHRHNPIEIEGSPVISRYPLDLQSPRRILLDPKENVFIADSGANKVFKMSPAGELTTVAEDLDEPSGLVLDQKGNLYIANHAQGEEEQGTIIRISPSGERFVFSEELTGPKGMAFDSKGNLYVALFDEHRIIRIDKKGNATPFVDEIDTPAGLVFDKQGNLYVACSLSGTVQRVSPDGKVTKVADDLKIPSDITTGPDGGIIVTNYQGSELTRIDAKGKTEFFLNVPPGTIGIVFDKAGNLLAANWDAALLLKITSRFSLPCPHCNKRIPVRLKQKRVKKNPPRKMI